jgi:hypothetical protein
MGEIQLTRSAGDRRLYALGDIGTVRFNGWLARSASADGVRELAVIAGQGWGRRPVTIMLDDPSALDPGLLLFAAFVVRGVAQDASAGD